MARKRTPGGPPCEEQFSQNTNTRVLCVESKYELFAWLPRAVISSITELELEEGIWAPIALKTGPICNARRQPSIVNLVTHFFVWTKCLTCLTRACLCSVGIWTLDNPVSQSLSHRQTSHFNSSPRRDYVSDFRYNCIFLQFPHHLRRCPESV